MQDNINTTPTIQEETPIQLQDSIVEITACSVARARELEMQCAPSDLPEGFFFKDNHLFFQTPNDEKAETIRVCSRLEVTACTRDILHENHGRLLRFVDLDGEPHEWAMPMSFLAGDSSEYRAVLLSKGLIIPPFQKSRTLLSNYIQSCQPMARARCVGQVGWCGSSFVFPSETIGPADAERILLQTASDNLLSYSVAGTLENWKMQVARYCEGNSRLTFAVSAAFAPPLLYPLDLESGGFHFRGPSSSGKTVALKLAVSVWGGEHHLLRWRTTSNGLEGVAAWHNDSLLCLDELGQVDPQLAGETAYMLANGTGKQRADKQGYARRQTTWRLLFFSTGEVGLSEHMLQVGKKMQTGQGIRMADIPADTGKHGVFEELHGFSSGELFADALREACHSYHGTAAREFIRLFVERRNEAIDQVRKFTSEFILSVTPPSASGQVKRVIGRFGLVAAAGELATLFGITGWEVGTAFRAAKTCCDDWLGTRGGAGQMEEQAVLTQIRRFFEQNGESQCTPWDSSEQAKTINRVGFRKINENGELEFFIFKESFKSVICQGLDSTYAVKICAKHGLLMLGANGEPTRPERLPGMERSLRVYRFTNLVLGEECQSDYLVE